MESCESFQLTASRVFVTAVSTVSPAIALSSSVDALPVPALELVISTHGTRYLVVSSRTVSDSIAHLNTNMSSNNYILL